MRRTCDKLEKDFLREKGVVTETQSDLGEWPFCVCMSVHGHACERD